MQAIFRRGYLALELGVFCGFEHLFEARARLVAGGDEVTAGDEKSGADYVGFGGLVGGFGIVVEAQVGVGA